MISAIAPTGVGPAPARDRAVLEPLTLRPTPDRDAVKAAAAKARSSPRFAASDHAKTQAREQVRQIVERLKVLRKLFAGDPEAMARALAQVFKDLKAAVQAYRRAGGEAFGLAAEASASLVGTGDRPMQDAVAREVKTALGEDGRTFVKELRSLANDIAKLLETTRTQARGGRPDRRRDEAIEEADQRLAELRDALHDMEQDIRKAAPEAGMRLSIEA